MAAGSSDSDHHSSRYLLSLERAEGTSTRRTGRFRAGLDRSGSCPCGARLRLPSQDASQILPVCATSCPTGIAFAATDRGRLRIAVLGIDGRHGSWRPRGWHGCAVTGNDIAPVLTLARGAGERSTTKCTVVDPSPLSRLHLLMSSMRTPRDTVLKQALCALWAGAPKQGGRTHH